MSTRKPYEDTIRMIDEEVIPNIDHLIDSRLRELRFEYEQRAILEMLLEDMGIHKKRAVGE